MMTSYSLCFVAMPTRCQLNKKNYIEKCKKRIARTETFAIVFGYFIRKKSQKMFQTIHSILLIIINELPFDYYLEKTQQSASEHGGKRKGHIKCSNEWMDIIMG